MLPTVRSLCNELAINRDLRVFAGSDAGNVSRWGVRDARIGNGRFLQKKAQSFPFHAAKSARVSRDHVLIRRYLKRSINLSNFIHCRSCNFLTR